MNKTWISFHLCSGLVPLPSVVIRMYDIVVIGVVLNSKQKIFIQSLAGIFEQTCDRVKCSLTLCELIISKKGNGIHLLPPHSQSFIEKVLLKMIQDWTRWYSEYVVERNSHNEEIWEKKRLSERKKELLDEQDVQDGQDCKAPWWKNKKMMTFLTKTV